MKNLDPKLREIVRFSTTELGNIIKLRCGDRVYHQVERIRSEMVSLRGKNAKNNLAKLQAVCESIKGLSKQDKHIVTQAFSLYLEIINSCESAYRQWVLSRDYRFLSRDNPQRIVFVTTAHPTEARSHLLVNLQNQLQDSLFLIINKKDINAQRKVSNHLIELMWQVSLTRHHKPEVLDEANYIYSIILKTNILDRLHSFNENKIELFFRTWVGGDKDGHPGVDEKTMLQSLQISRGQLLKYFSQKLNTLRTNLSELSGEFKLVDKYLQSIEDVEKSLRSLEKIKVADGKKVLLLHAKLEALQKCAHKLTKHLPLELRQLRSIIKNFPGMVVPLEFRESSDVIEGCFDKSRAVKLVNIERMLATLKSTSSIAHPSMYVRGLVISMVRDANDLILASRLVKKHLGKCALRIIPLLEKRDALENVQHILEDAFKFPLLKQTMKQEWRDSFEIMLGYSDSAKEIGVLPSRLLIGESLQKANQTCLKHKIRPVFFHGSGGSVARGGGSLQEQIQWWPKFARSTYKVTLQGEMVARTLAHPSIVDRNVDIICQTLATTKQRVPKISKATQEFVQSISEHYQVTIQDPDFLKMIQLATPYAYINKLKLGSRPSKRPKTGELRVDNLRAIPWVMCWTQNRILFPTWWGLGSAWKDANQVARKKIVADFKSSPLLSSYLKMLGFTLSKVELSVFYLYLENSALSKEEKTHFKKLFQKEFELTTKFFREVSSQKEFLWFRPWLQDSIDLRSTMIHPINLLQLIALEERDDDLLRKSVVGISCGMLTTG